MDFLKLNSEFQNLQKVAQQQRIIAEQKDEINRLNKTKEL